MKCPNCGKVNYDDAKYCEECSTPLPTKFSFRLPMNSIENSVKKGSNETSMSAVQNDIECTPQEMLFRKWWVWLVIAVAAFGAAAMIFSPKDKKPDYVQPATEIFSQQMIYDSYTAEAPTNSSSVESVPCIPAIMGEALRADDAASINLGYCFWADELETINEGDASFEFGNEKDMMYFVVAGTVTNLYSEYIEPGNLLLKLKFGNDNSFESKDCSVLTETYGGSDMYKRAEKIAPGASENIFAVFSAPEEAYFNFESSELFVGFDRKFSDSVKASRNFGICDYVYSVLLAN